METIFIVGHGARTPLGLQAASSAAARRGGISAAAHHPFMIDRAGDPMTLALDPELDPALMGWPRLFALAASALQEACAVLMPRADDNLQIPLLLALPELRPGFSALDVEALRTGLASQAELPVRVGEVTVSARGHAAGVALFAVAAEHLRQGRSELCLVGGVDSYLDPDTLDWLEAHRQLAGAVARSAFVPGEGAGFCLLATGSVCERLGLQPLATLRTVAIGRETRLIKTDDICLGEGLTAVVKNVSDQLRLPAESINTVICDINGERYRGEEWGFVCLRAGTGFDDPTGYWSPADVWGDTGAASGPLFAMLACQAAARGYAAGPRTMLWASSEKGLRAAALLETALAPSP